MKFEDKNGIEIKHGDLIAHIHDPTKNHEVKELRGRLFLENYQTPLDGLKTEEFWQVNIPVEERESSLQTPPPLKKEKEKEKKDVISKTEPSGLGGWLILPMLGLIFLPIKLGAMLVTIYYPIFSEGYWEVLTSPESEAYHTLWAPLLIFEIVGNSSFLLASIVLLVLFFQKHHRFPSLMIWFLGLNLAFVGIDFFAADLIPAVAAEPDPESTKELIRTIVASSIWIPYFLKSVRVKNTFTN